MYVVFLFMLPLTMTMMKLIKVRWHLEYAKYFVVYYAKGLYLSICYIACLSEGFYFP